VQVRKREAGVTHKVAVLVPPDRIGLLARVNVVRSYELLESLQVPAVDDFLDQAADDLRRSS
jgi:hypothetical protein